MPLNLKAMQVSATLRDSLADPYGIAEPPQATPRFEDLPEPPKTGPHPLPWWAYKETAKVPLDPKAFAANANGELDPDGSYAEEHFLDIDPNVNPGPLPRDAMGTCQQCGGDGYWIPEDAPPMTAPRTCHNCEGTGRTGDRAVPLPSTDGLAKPDSREAHATAYPPLPPEEADVIAPIQRLLHERRELVAEWAILKARHGDGGTWTSRRHNLRAALAESVKQEAISKSEKWTEAGVDREAEADPKYLSFLEEGETERTRMYVLENEIASIGDVIRRGNGLLYAVGGEQRLPQ